MARVSRFGAFIATLALVLPGAVSAQLTAPEIQQLSRFAGAAGFRDVPDWARAAKEAEVRPAYVEMRALFAGRGRDVAPQFLLASRTQGKTPNTMARALLRVGPAVALPPVLALLACGVTRSNGLFPIGSEGWGLIFEPLSSALFALVVAAVLVLVDGVFFRRIAAAA